MRGLALRGFTAMVKGEVKGGPVEPQTFTVGQKKEIVATMIPKLSKSPKKGKKKCWSLCTGETRAPQPADLRDLSEQRTTPGFLAE